MAFLYNKLHNFLHRSDKMKQQFEMTRGMLLNFVLELEKMDDKQILAVPEGFQNNILWHIGHVLVTAEAFMFGYPQQASGLNPAYAGLFAMGTKPADWESDVPALQILKEDLSAQLEKIRGLDDNFLAGKLPFQFPVPNIHTFADLYHLMSYHEAEHIGQMKAMRKLV